MIANPEVWQIDMLQISIRIAMAVLIGGMIGLERERGKHHAGLRTHILVCLGSTLITLISIYGFSQFAYEPNVRMDPARLSAQIISGIGFLGAGTILRTGNTVSGLTTAASLWVVAALGIAIGAGFYYGALLSFVLVLICLFLLQLFEKRFMRPRNTILYSITISQVGDPGVLIDFFQNEGIKIKNIKMDVTEEGLVKMEFAIPDNHLEFGKKMSKMAVNSSAGVKHIEVVT